MTNQNLNYLLYSAKCMERLEKFAALLSKEDVKYLRNALQIDENRPIFQRFYDEHMTDFLSYVNLSAAQRKSKKFLPDDRNLRVLLIYSMTQFLYHTAMWLKYFDYNHPYTFYKYDDVLFRTCRTYQEYQEATSQPYWAFDKYYKSPFE